MATQTIRVSAAIPSGSYTVNVQADGSNTNEFSGRTLTAESVSSFWTFTVTSATAGLYAFQVLNGSSAVVAYGWFYSATDATVTIQDSNSRDDALQTQVIVNPLVESYAADGSAPTLTQAVMLTMQSINEASISGTTKTVKKLDGSTTAATFTLDSSTAPTSITRAT